MKVQGLPICVKVLKCNWQFTIDLEVIHEKDTPMSNV